MKTIRKNFLLLAFAAGALFLIGNNVFGLDPTTPGHEPPGGGGNTATCYSTYVPPGILGGGTIIFRCGICSDIKARTFSDPGICSF